MKIELMKTTFEVITPDLETLQRILQAVRNVEQADPARIHLRILGDEETAMHEQRWLDMLRKVEPPLPEEFMLRWKK